jgi:MFS family permease
MSFQRPHDFDLSPPALETAGLAPGFRIYLVAVAFIAAGYADFALIAYHFGKTAVMPVTWILIAYAISMAVDGAAGLALGSLFDRIGLRAMILATVISAAAAPLVFLGGFAEAVLGMVCWGIGTGAQESVMRDNRSAGTPRPACDGLWHFQRGLWYRLVCRQRPARHPLRPLDRRRGDCLDGIAGGGVAGLVPAGAPADRVIGIAPAPAMS